MEKGLTGLEDISLCIGSLYIYSTNIHTYIYLYVSIHLYAHTYTRTHTHTHTNLGSSAAISTQGNFSPGVLRTCERQKINAAHFLPLDNILLGKKLGERRGRVKIVEYQNLMKTSLNWQISPTRIMTF